ncbi:hypothetical protein EYF80_003687 [Liparis tanakae]|uniref:Uncharacterized protein n=1 Tax=Liparis tanakae TaxID=230148 RepID=A0A4Z2J874_9TELE|nr:hypothetical protein EYF80_003687 [Liparis tanakae]
MGIKEPSAGLIRLLGQPALDRGGRVASNVPDQCSGGRPVTEAQLRGTQKDSRSSLSKMLRSSAQALAESSLIRTRSTRCPYC